MDGVTARFPWLAGLAIAATIAATIASQDSERERWEPYYSHCEQLPQLESERDAIRAQRAVKRLERDLELLDCRVDAALGMVQNAQGRRASADPSTWREYVELSARMTALDCQMNVDLRWLESASS